MKLQSDGIQPEIKTPDPLKTFYDHFKAFAFKGNVVDLAVGMVIGTAFGGLIKSLVDHVIMPLASLFLPTTQKYTEWCLHIDGKSIPYGKFIAEFVNFIIIALAVYIFVVQFVAWLSRKPIPAPLPPPSPPPPTKEELLLTEIRDLLKAQQPN
jgi:large conductance mechanosensitive channel